MPRQDFDYQHPTLGLDSHESARSPDPEDEKSNGKLSRFRSIGRKGLVGALVAASPISIAAPVIGAGELYDHRPTTPAHITTLSGLPKAEKPENYQDNRLTLFIGGFGRAVGKDMATNAYPITSEFGKSAYLTTNPKNLDQEELVQTFEDAILPEADEGSGKLDLIIYAQSAGPKMIFPALNQFVQEHQAQINVELILLDSAPYDSSDIRSGLPSQIINHPDLIFGGQPVLTIAQAYSLSQDFPTRHSLAKIETWHDARNIASQQTTPGLRAQINAIQKPLGELDGLTADQPDAYYLRPAQPEVDNLVDTNSAFEDWHEKFATYDIKLGAIAVESNSHAALVRGGNDTTAYNSALEQIYSKTFDD